MQNALQNTSDMVSYTRGDSMEESNDIYRDTDYILKEIKRLINEYQQKLKEGFSDPKNFIKMSEIERMLCSLNQSTENLYLKSTIAALLNLDEKELIAAKKRVPRQRDPSENRSEGDTGNTYAFGRDSSDEV